VAQCFIPGSGLFRPDAALYLKSDYSSQDKIQ